jgi:hypothetical protein
VDRIETRTCIRAETQLTARAPLMKNGSVATSLQHHPLRLVALCSAQRHHIDPARQVANGEGVRGAVHGCVQDLAAEGIGEGDAGITQRLWGANQ